MSCDDPMLDYMSERFCPIKALKYNINLPYPDAFTFDYFEKYVKFAVDSKFQCIINILLESDSNYCVKNLIEINNRPQKLSKNKQLSQRKEKLRQITFGNDESSIKLKISKVKIEKKDIIHPMFQILEDSILNTCKILVKTRGLKFFRSVLIGNLLAYDHHFNLIMYDTTELLIVSERHSNEIMKNQHGSKDFKTPFDWQPIKANEHIFEVTKGHKLISRYLKQAMIKGNNIIIISLLNNKKTINKI